MAAVQSKTSRTEADLESAMHHAIKLAFPWLPPGSIHHQTKLSFTFGHRNLNVDGAEAWEAGGRSDIVLYHEDTPLAVLELKRAGKPLTPADDAQGLSYARVLNPSPPLVVVTNGAEVHFIETHSGMPWLPTEPSYQAFQALVENAASMAAGDMQNAIDTLMGTNAAVWMQAVRQVSAATVDDLSSSLEAPARPFAKGFLIPRRVTDQVLKSVSAGTRLALVEGPPLAGKSNVLREISCRSEQSQTLAALLVEAGVGAGVLQSLADALGRSLDWRVTREEARSWLLRVSQSSDRRLLLLIDGLDAGDKDTQREIEDLSSMIFGEGLSIIVAVDDVTADKVLKAPNGLTESAIGRRAMRFRVGPLDDQEFEFAQDELRGRQVKLMHGAQSSPEYRHPWILRAISALAIGRAKDALHSAVAVLPPLLSLDLIGFARERFADDELRRHFKAIAKAFIFDVRDETRDLLLRLESLEVNLVRRETLRKFAEASELEWLIDRSFVKSALHASGDPILFIRLPELLASELARLLADELEAMVRDDARGAAKWIADEASHLPIGDVIAAQAIFDAARGPRGLPFEFIEALVETPPQLKQMTAGGRYAVFVPGMGHFDLNFDEDGTAEVDINGHLLTIEQGDGDISDSYTNIHQWLILSHLAALAFVIEAPEGPARVDPDILLVVGSANIALRKPSGDLQMRGTLTHDVAGIGSVVCHHAGIIEPITYSIFRYLQRGGASTDDWIQAAIAKDSMPLLGRIHIALIQLSHSASPVQAMWAQETLATKIMPAFKLFPELHGSEG